MSQMDIPIARGSKSWYWLALAALLAVGGLVAGTAIRYGPTGLPYEYLRNSVEVKRGDLARRVDVGGRMVPKHSVVLSAKDEGTVQEIHVDAGEHVVKGDLILGMENRRLQTEVGQLELDLARALAQRKSRRAQLTRERMRLGSEVKSLELDLEAAKLEHQAKQELYRKKVASAIAVQQSELKVKKLRERVAAQRRMLKFHQEALHSELSAKDAHIDKLKQRLREARARESALEVQASIAGVVQQVNVGPGEQVKRGTALAKIADSRSFLGEVKVPEQYSQSVRVGLPASVRLGSHSVAAIVVRVEPTVEEGFIRAYLEPEKEWPEAAMRRDRSFDARIELNRFNGVLHVSSPPGIHGKKRVLAYRVAHKEHELRQVRLHLGATTMKEAQIVRGASEGDRLLFRLPENLQGRQRIPIVR